MKKIIVWTILLSSTIISSCSFMEKEQVNVDEKEEIKKVDESLNPQEVLKNTQVSFLNTMNDNVLTKDKVAFDWNVFVSLMSPQWTMDSMIDYNGKMFEEKSDFQISLNSNVEAMWKEFELDLIADFLLNSEKIYMKLMNFNVDSSDPQVKILQSMSQTFVGKWFFIENENTLKQLDNKKLDFLKKYKETPVFKFEKKIEDNKYQVSLNKETLIDMSYELNQSINPELWITKDQLKDEIWKSNFNWVVTVFNMDNGYFSFSWDFVNNLWNEYAISFKNTSNSIEFMSDMLEIIINKDWNKFNGNISLLILDSNQKENIDIDWELTEKKLDLNLLYKREEFDIDLNLVYNAEEIDSLNLEIPDNAKDLLPIINQMWWWFPWMYPWNSMPGWLKTPIKTK